jgi:Ras-related protein Rab-32
MADGEDITEYLFKILIVGDIGVGKTSIIKRYVHNIFSIHYKSTVRTAPYFEN